MSRTLTSAMLDAKGELVVRPVMLLEADFSSGMVYMTPEAHSLPWDGHTYTGLGQMLSVDRFEEREELSAAGVRVALSAVPSALVTQAREEHYQGRDLTIRFGLCDEDHQIIEDPCVIWAGYMDTMAIQFGPRTSTITLTGVHRLHDMDRARGGRYNDGDHQARYTGDKYFEFLEELQNADLVWGYWKAPVDSTPRDGATSGYVNTGGGSDAGTRGYITSGAAQRARDSATRGYL